MTTTHSTLRLAGPRDAEAIAIMSRELVEVGLGWRYRPEYVRRLIDDPDTVVLIADTREGVTGFAIMAFGDERAHLVLLAVRPTHRRRGTGRRLIEWQLDSAATAGIASIHLELRVGNVAARTFYRALGFTDTVRIPGYYGGREAAIRMVRVLRAPAPQLVSWQARFDRR